MIKKVVKKQTLQESSRPWADREYWLKKTPTERVAAVDYLRQQFYGHTIRLQRTTRIIQRP